jgi:hypothetical protein
MSSKHIFQLAHMESLYNDLRRTNTEQAKKERFLQYLTTSFAGEHIGVNAHVRPGVCGASSSP